MAGYCNYSMSNNAVDAYASGEMPLSKWTKTAILDRCGEKAAQLSPLTVAELRDLLLISCGWHHTSNHFNRTPFYTIDEDALNEVSDATISGIISARKPKERKPAAPIKTVTAEITYTVWEGHYRNYRRPRDYTEIVTYKSTDKQVQTANGGVKRLSSLKSIRVISEV